jgi:hypothetical protein
MIKYPDLSTMMMQRVVTIITIESNMLSNNGFAIVAQRKMKRKKPRVISY